VNANARLYSAKAWECLSLAESMNDPARRADMLRFARAWFSLTEPIGDLPIAYEWSQPRYSSGKVDDALGKIALAPKQAAKLLPTSAGQDQELNKVAIVPGPDGTPHRSKLPVIRSRLAS
jgi:hypothetical protein